MLARWRDQTRAARTAIISTNCRSRAIHQAKRGAEAVATNAAREEKNYARADEVRDRLGGMGVTIEDGPEGTRWRRA